MPKLRRGDKVALDQRAKESARLIFTIRLQLKTPYKKG